MPVLSADKNYQAALDYLYSFVDYSLTRSFRYSAEKFNLERMVKLLDSIGNPQKDYRIVHVAGTKGKGSTAAFCAQAFIEAGYTTGLYTSPHLEDYCERIQINNRMISHGELVDELDSLKPVIQAIPELTTFEITTALAFLYFSKWKVDIVVAEVGLGGRLDATNVVMPMVSVITSISYDHTNVLGNTLTEIAGEKAGIIKEHIPVVISPQTNEARAVFQRVCQEKNAPLYQVGTDVLFRPISHSLDGQALNIWGLEAKLPGPLNDGGIKGFLDRNVIYEIPLLGSHQLENAATAFTAIQICNASGMVVPVEAVQKGFATVRWPGRFEILSRHPLVIIDSAHNRDSALRLRNTLDEYLAGKKIVMIFGASEDKDIEGILTELKPRITRLLATRSEHPRAESPGEIHEIAEKLSIPVEEFESVELTLEYLREYIDPDFVILATGSIFVAAAVRNAWMK